MEKMQLYEAAMDAKRMYQENGEELTDFDAFMDELEAEYELKRKVAGK